MRQAGVFAPVVRRLAQALALAAGPILGVGQAAESARTTRWEGAIRAFEQSDKKSPPPKGAILFAGSSSIRGWDVRRCFPKLDTINRGFGGSQIADSTAFAHRIILPCEPRIIVLYAGDNDIAAGKSPQRVLEDFKAFVKTIHDKLPKTRILFIAIKPSLARWRLVERMRAANKLIAEHAEAAERLGYVDIDTPMIGQDGRPRRELFRRDGLHLSAQGYKLWTSILLPHLEPPPGTKKPDPAPQR